MMNMQYLLPMIICMMLVGCTGQDMTGSDRDEHGCIASAGYSWCEARGECVRVWENPCTAEDLCRKDGVSVYICGDLVKEVRDTNKETIYYEADWNSFTCDRENPSPRCTMIFDIDCRLVCQRTVVGTDDEAQRISIEYVESLPSFQREGKEIIFESIERMTCSGCYNTRLKYILNDGNVTSVEISIVNMDISDVTTRQEGSPGGSGLGGSAVSTSGSFDDCVAKGNPVMESYPRQCSYPDGRTFTEAICVDMCGDGICQEMVCMGEGCPCAETRVSCPLDCS